MIQFHYYFSDGLVQPPTSYSFSFFNDAFSGVVECSCESFLTSMVSLEGDDGISIRIIPTSNFGCHPPPGAFHPFTSLPKPQDSPSPRRRVPAKFQVFGGGFSPISPLTKRIVKNDEGKGTLKENLGCCFCFVFKFYPEYIYINIRIDVLYRGIYGRRFCHFNHSSDDILFVKR